MGRRRRDPVDARDGVFVIDKDPGMTSHDVVGRVRRMVMQRRVGHAGTLDPDATGVLVLGIGRATRLVPYLQAGRKTYVARMRLGATTTTLDAAGEVLTTTDASAVTEEALRTAFTGFIGDIEQIPPMVSAIKVDGERLYEKARRGEEIERAPRPVTIHDVVLDEFVPGVAAEATITVTCGSGTYIRSLAADIGDVLGVGAHLVALRRTASGRFNEDDARSLETLEAMVTEGRLDEVLLTPAQAMSDFPVRVAKKEEVKAISYGQFLKPTRQEGPVALVDEAGTLWAIIEDRDGRAKALVVFAEPAEEGAEA